MRFHSDALSLLAPAALCCLQIMYSDLYSHKPFARLGREGARFQRSKLCHVRRLHRSPQGRTLFLFCSIGACSRASGCVRWCCCPLLACELVSLPTSPHALQLLKACWPVVLENVDTVISQFYEHLFEKNPSVVPLFEGIHLDTQKKMLGSVLNTLVNGLDDVGALVPTLQRLGQRHQSYGAQPAHFGAVGGSLVWSLAQQLGDNWNEELHAAWVSVYGLVVKVMLSAPTSERTFAKAADALAGLQKGTEMTRAAFVAYSLARGLSVEEADAVFDHVDKNQDGTLDSDEVPQ